MSEGGSSGRTTVLGLIIRGTSNAAHVEPFYKRKFTEKLHL